MCLHAARLPARLDAAGDLVALREQDRGLWDAAASPAEGKALLDAAATGDEVSEYHVEAAIAAVHVDAASADDTRWGEIVALYDVLMGLRPSPIVALGSGDRDRAGRRSGRGAGRAPRARGRRTAHACAVSRRGDRPISSGRRDAWTLPSGTCRRRWARRAIRSRGGSSRSACGRSPTIARDEASQG